MSQQTKIEWCVDPRTGRRGATWNPIRGCTRVSEGCTHCFAERIAMRFSGEVEDIRDENDGLVGLTKPQPFYGFADEDGWTGRVELIESKLEEPLRRKKPTLFFVSSMSDPNHAALPDEARDKILAIMTMTPQHLYVWLTKRAENMQGYFSDPNTPFRVLRAADCISVDQEWQQQQEEWRDIVQYEGIYQVSNAGSIRRITSRATHLIKSRDNGRGYRSVCLSKQGRVCQFLVHRLVLEAFRRPAPSGEESCHRNGNRTDNRLPNLSWGTRQENMEAAARHGTAGVWMKGRATLTPEQVEDIRARRVAGELLDDIAAVVGSNRKQVCAVARGKIFKPAPLGWPLPNLWLGCSVENDKHLDRLDWLMKTPAALRFVSLEPMLSEIALAEECEDCGGVGHTGRARDGRLISCETCGGDEDDLGRGWNGPLADLDLVICGGETGPGARPMQLDWARRLRDDCTSAGVPFFLKSLGCWTDDVARFSDEQLMVKDRADGGVLWENRAPQMVRVGRKAAGRLLDGREWSQMPEVSR